MEATQAPYTDGDTRRHARRGLAIFFPIVVALSIPIEAVIIAADLDGGRNGLIPYLSLIAALMFVPTIASVVARLALKEGFSDISFRLGGRRGRTAILQALVLPVLIGLVVYGIGWATGLVGFSLPSSGGWIDAIAVLLVLNLFLASGEVMGWRGTAEKGDTSCTQLPRTTNPLPTRRSGVWWPATRRRRSW